MREGAFYVELLRTVGYVEEADNVFDAMPFISNRNLTVLIAGPIAVCLTNSSQAI